MLDSYYADLSASYQGSVGCLAGVWGARRTRLIPRGVDYVFADIARPGVQNAKTAAALLRNLPPHQNVSQSTRKAPPACTVIGRRFFDFMAACHRLSRIEGARVPRRELSSMSDRPEGAKIIQIPIVLALDCSPTFLVRCRKVAARSRLLVRTCDAASAWRTAVSLQPLAIVVPCHLHERAPRRFSMLAAEAGARLVVLESEQLPLDELHGHLTLAVCEAARARA
jgi:hypothetical protein